jgi:hypothetical protein
MAAIPLFRGGGANRRVLAFTNSGDLGQVQQDFFGPAVCVPAFDAEFLRADDAIVRAIDDK